MSDLSNDMQATIDELEAEIKELNEYVAACAEDVNRVNAENARLEAAVEFLAMAYTDPVKAKREAMEVNDAAKEEQFQQGISDVEQKLRQEWSANEVHT